MLSYYMKFFLQHRDDEHVLRVYIKPDSCINPALFFKQTAYIQYEPPVARLLLDLTKSEVQKTA